MYFDIKDIYEQYAAFVYNIALKLLYNKIDAEDVVQDVFIKLQNKMGTFKGNSSIKTFIYRVTINQSIDYIKKQRSQFSRMEKSCETTESQIKDDNLVLNSLLERLSEKQRKIVLLFEIAGCSQKEISEIMGVSVGTVKSTLSRSIEKMAEMAKED
jgi:RNA polymerase sigma-70 factor, ECF subfamily